MMTWPFYTLLILGLFCVGLATAKTKEQVQAEELDARLAGVESELNACINANCTVEALLHLIRDDIFDLRVDQELMKEDLVSRLDAIKDDELTSRIEHILAKHYRDFRPSGNFSKVHTSCEAAFNAGWTKSGVYRVSPKCSSVTMDVYCEQESFGGGWTVFQRRINGKFDFYRTWNEYKKGFGDVNAEFWLGNDNLHLLTTHRNQILKVELELEGSGFCYATYNAFWVNSEAQKYQLHASGFSAGDPNPGDSFSQHSDYYFTTKDRDNDIWFGNCAKNSYGAWWYSNCHVSNLNGVYGATGFSTGVNWATWAGYYRSMTGVRMMIRTKPSLLVDGEIKTN